MKKMILLLVLAGINSNNFAQQLDGPSARFFELPPNSVKVNFLLELGPGSKMQIELTDRWLLSHLDNPDSLVTSFLRDMEPLKDSLQDELWYKHIYYNVVNPEFNKVLIRQTKAEAIYVVRHGDAAFLKLEQDTITIIGNVMEDVGPGKIQKPHYYRISFFLDNYKQLSPYVGVLGEKVLQLQSGKNGQPAGDSTMHFKSNRGSAAKTKRGVRVGDAYLDFRFSVNVQNYKSYFVPSFSVGMGYVVSHRTVTQEFALYLEDLFVFAQEIAAAPANTTGNLHTYSNSFLSFSYNRYHVRGDGEIHPTIFLPVSIGLLLSRQGGYFKKGTVRLGIGGIQFFGGKTTIEPLVYTNTNSFFRSFTPGLRIVQGF